VSIAPSRQRSRSCRAHRRDRKAVRPHCSRGLRPSISAAMPTATTTSTFWRSLRAPRSLSDNDARRSCGALYTCACSTGHGKRPPTSLAQRVRLRSMRSSRSDQEDRVSWRALSRFLCRTASASRSPRVRRSSGLLCGRDRKPAGRSGNARRPGPRRHR
jgi:hypothetical protein